VAISTEPIVQKAEPSWNPLRCGGTALPTNLLLMAKLIALCLLLTNHVRLLPDPFLPFVPAFDGIGSPAAFQLALQFVFLAAALALLFNRGVRASCLALGGAILIGVISSKAYYGNNKTFCGLILFLTGLYEPGSEPWLLRAQFAIVYFGAGLNKLLDADWRSGLFMDHWATVRLRQGAYIAAASWLPPMLLAKLMCWGTLLTELGMAVAFLIRRWFAAGILASLLFQSSLLLFAGSTFTMFFYATQAALLMFVEWPRSRWLVIYDGDCGFCNRSKSWGERLDLDGLLEWQPFQSGAGRAYGISDADATQRLYLVAGTKIYSGFGAFRMMLLFNPITYFAMAVLIAAPPGDAALYRRIVVAALLIFFLPPFAPIGEWAYRLVARNRYRLSANSACAVPVNPHRRGTNS
jgi:predicted DCC family thiol-disulfide oxidoreductase YuxK